MKKHSSSRAADVRELSACLLQASTATEALFAWCEARGISSGPITVARQRAEERSDPDGDMLDELRPRRDERIAYRSVRLMRGCVLLSEADNWFVPDRLPADIRGVLEATNVPFGAAVARLRPSRRTYFVRFAEWTNDDPGSAGRSAGLPSAMTILEHKAVVLDRDRQPLAVVAERYRLSLIEEPVPAPSADALDRAEGERSFWGLRIWRWCTRCSARSRQRTALAELDDRLLEDVGVTRQQASNEAAKPFWR